MIMSPCRRPAGQLNQLRRRPAQLRVALHDDYEFDLEKYKDGLLLLTGGIENGFLAKPASLNNAKLVKDRIRYLKTIFNDNLYVELQRHGIKSQLIAEKILIDFCI